MPAYFSLDTFFKPVIYDGFVKDIYNKVIESGFDFVSGVNEAKDMTFDELCIYNEGLLRSRFQLRLDQLASEGYKQVYFQHKEFTSIRCFWIHCDEYIMFSLIVPEADIIKYDMREYSFVEDKIKLLISTATKLMNLKNSLVAQTSREISDGSFELNEVENKNLSVDPFAYVNSDNVKFNIEGYNFAIGGNLIYFYV